MCVDHVGAGELTIDFSPMDQGLHLPSLAEKVNAPLMPEDEVRGFQMTGALPVNV